MKATISGASTNTVQYTAEIGYIGVQYESQLVVGAGALSIVNASAASLGVRKFAVFLRNSSVGGQNIRIGVAPAFGGAPVGILLIPTAQIQFIGIASALNALADAPGALLDRLVFFM